MFYLSKSPLVAALGVFSGCGSGWCRARTSTAMKAVRGSIMWGRCYLTRSSVLACGCFWVGTVAFAGVWGTSWASWGLSQCTYNAGWAFLCPHSCPHQEKYLPCWSSPEHPQSANNTPVPQAAVLASLLVLGLVACLLPSTNPLPTWLFLCCLIQFWRTHVSMPSVIWCQPTVLFNAGALPCPTDSKAHQEDVSCQGGLCWALATSDFGKSLQFQAVLQRSHMLGQLFFLVKKKCWN